MFEKESEEWADKGFAEKYKTLEWYARKNNFQKGAEFGYNKAKEEYEVKLKVLTENRDELLAEIESLEERVGELKECY